MIVPAETACAEIEVRKSRFIACAFYCDSFDALKKAIADTRALHPGARHVVHAAIIGTQFSVSDDREPKNTAGRPVLEVLKGSGVTNVGLTVTRYFGGILLGTGGLVKAYGDSAKAVLAVLKTEEYTPRVSVLIRVGYELHDQAQRILTACQATDINCDFADSVTVTAMVPASCKDRLEHDFSEASNGRATPVWC